MIAKDHPARLHLRRSGHTFEFVQAAFASPRSHQCAEKTAKHIPTSVKLIVTVLARVPQDDVQKLHAETAAMVPATIIAMETAKVSGHRHHYGIYTACIDTLQSILP